MPVLALPRWGDLEFPLPFGRTMTAAEEYVHELDSKTGASLKLSILNPKARPLLPLHSRQFAVHLLLQAFNVCARAVQQPRQVALLVAPSCES